MPMDDFRDRFLAAFGCDAGDTLTEPNGSLARVTAERAVRARIGVEAP